MDETITRDRLHELRGWIKSQTKERYALRFGASSNNTFDQVVYTVGVQSSAGRSLSPPKWIHDNSNIVVRIDRDSI